MRAWRFRRWRRLLPAAAPLEASSAAGWLSGTSRAQILLSDLRVIDKQIERV